MPSTILSDNGASSGTAGIKTTGSNDGILALQTTTAGGTATTALTIDTGQRTKFPTTIGVGDATPSTSGSGISFPATQSASTDANTLDDYEEGTWTPILADASTGGNTAASYTINNGFYTKIGQLVTVNVIFTFPVTTGMTGANQAFIRGLPFATPNLDRGESTGATWVRNVTLAAGQTYFATRTIVNSTNMQIMQSGSNTTESTTIVSNIASGTALIRLTLTYNTV